MTDNDWRKLRINNRIVLRLNINPSDGLYNGAHGTIIDIVYVNQINLDLGIKSLVIKFDTSDRYHTIHGIKSEDYQFDASHCITNRILIFPISHEYMMTPYNSQ